MRRDRIWCLVLAVLVLPLCSCLWLTGFVKEETIRGTEPRQVVAFETPVAAELFEAAVRQRFEADQGNLKTVGVSILFVTHVTKTTKLAESAFYNDQVQICDLNHDGLIAEAEARFYARTFGHPVTEKSDNESNKEAVGPVLPIPVPALGAEKPQQ